MNTRIYGILCFLLYGALPLSAQWAKTNGPPGIRATQFYESGNVLYVGTDAQGVYKSSDNGNTWVAANTGIDNRQVLSLAGDGTYIYAGTGATDTGTDGVYRSSNQGATWVAANAGIQDKSVNRLLVAAGQLFAGTVGQGVYKSSNQGTSWTNANGGALGSSSIYAMFFAASRLTVEADNYLFYTFDFGNNWFVDNGPTAFYTIDQILQKGDTVIAVAGSNTFWTHNGGVTWSNANLLDPNSQIDILGIDRKNDTIYAAHSEGIFRSLNWGVSWTNLPSSGLRFGKRYNYNFRISGPNFLISCEEIGIYKSSNKGSTWTQVPLNQFEAASTIDNALLVIGNTIYSGTHNDGVYSSTNQGDTWTKTGTANPLDTLSNAIIFAMLNPAPNIILAGACGYGLYRSADNGSTWTHITSGLPVQAGTGFACINTLALSGTKVIAATTEGIYYSSNNGLTWAATNIAGSQVLYSSGLAVNANVVVTGIFSPTLGSGIWRSTNSGVNWTLVNTSVMDVIAMGAGGNNHFYASNYNNNYVSSDNGLSWSAVGPGIPFDVGGFAILSFNQFVFIGNNKGVFFSNNYGSSFTDYTPGMDPYPNNAVQGFAMDNYYVYAGTFLDAMWRRPQSDFGIIPPCSTVVTNVNNSGTGSLRDAISCAPSGATITFNSGLTDQTITLTSGEITINKDVTIAGLGMTHLTLSGNNASRVFHLLPGINFTVKDLSLKNGNAVSNGGAIYSEGHLILQNVLFQNNIGNSLPRALTITGTSVVNMMGTVNVKI